MLVRKTNLSFSEARKDIYKSEQTNKKNHCKKLLNLRRKKRLFGKFHSWGALNRVFWFRKILVFLCVVRLKERKYVFWKLKISIYKHDTAIKGTSGFHKTVRVCHVYCNFKIGFTCRITVIFGTLKDGSLLINTLASNICFNYRNVFQNGVDALAKIVDAFFVKKFKILSSSDYLIVFKFC